MMSVSNGIFQMKNTECSVFFPLTKIFKNLIVPLPTKNYPVLLCNTFENLKP